MRPPIIRRWTAAVAAVAVGAVAMLGTVPAVAAAPFDRIANDTVWRDTDGHEIRAQGGNVFKNDDDGTWYWVGSNLPAAQDTWDPRAKSINLYSSTDLESWTFVKALVTQSDDASALNVGLAPGADPADLTVGTWLGRPQLIRHPTNGTWIIWAEVPGGKTAPRSGSEPVALGVGQAVFTSDTLTGTYTYQGKHFVKHDNGDGTFTDGYTSGDRSVFVDGDKAYLVYVGDSLATRNVDLNIAPLDADWTRVENPIWTVANGEALGGSRYEAPGIVKVDQKYYLFASHMRGFNASQTHYRTTTNSALTGWSGFAPVPSAPVPSVSDSFGTQFESIIPIVGTAGTSYLYNGDRYSQYYPKDLTVPDAAKKQNAAPSGTGRNAWYPLTFESGVPRLHGATDVEVDADAGTLTWNRIANGRFDQRKVDDPRGNHPLWSFAGSTRIEETTNAATKQQLVIAGTDFTGTASQSLTLPAGTYALSVDHKSKYALGQGSVSITGNVAPVGPLDLTAPAPTFTTKTLTFTVTTAGPVTVKIEASGATGRLEVDNVSVWKQ